MRRGALPRLVTRLRPERHRLAAAAVLAVISVGFSITGPLLLGNATNILFDGVVGGRLHAGLTKAQEVAALRAHGHRLLADMLSAMNVVPGRGVDFAGLGRVLGLTALVYLVGAAFLWAQGYVMTAVAQRTVLRLREEVEDKLARLPLRYFDGNPRGDIISRVTNDIDNLATTLQDVFSELLTLLVMAGGVMGMMFWISPLLAGVWLAIIPMGMIAAVRLARRSRAQFTAQWGLTGALTGLVEETHSGHALVLAYGQRQAVIGAFNRQNDQLREVSIRGQFLAGMVQPLFGFAANLNYVIIAVLGAYQVATGAILLGSLQAMIPYSRISAQPVTQLASQLNLFQSGLASAARVFEILDEPEEAPDGHAAVPSLAQVGAARGVRLANVSFRYRPDQPLIEDFTLEVAPGQTVALVGPTGAGKTTIVNLLMRFYEIDRRTRSTSTASTTGTSTATRCAAASAWCCRTPGCSGARSGTTSRTGTRTRPGGDRRRGQGRLRRPVRPHAARRLRHRPGRRGIGSLGRPEAAGDDRPRVARRPRHPDPGRGDKQRRHPHRDDDQERDGQAASGPDQLRDRAPAVHRPQRGHDSRHGRRPYRRAGQSRRTAAVGRPVPRPVLPAVRCAARAAAHRTRRDGYPDLKAALIPMATAPRPRAATAGCFRAGRGQRVPRRAPRPAGVVSGTAR